MPQYLTQQPYINDQSFDSSQRSSGIGQHLTSERIMNQQLNHTQPLRGESALSMADIRQSLDRLDTQPLSHEQLRYAEKLIKDNQNLGNKFENAKSQLQKVILESQRLKLIHGDIKHQTQKCQQEIQELAKHEQAVTIQMQISQLRNMNVAIEQNIGQTQYTRQEAVRQLKMLQNQRENTVYNIKDKKTDQQHKLAVMKEVEIQRAFETQKLGRIEKQIQKLQIELVTQNEILYDDQQMLSRLNHEKHEIITKVQDLNSLYQNQVKDNIYERKRTLEHVRHQRIILAAKSTFLFLESCLKKRKSQAFSDFIFYNEFDNRCQNALSSFARVLERQGRQKLSIYLSTWFQNTYDPVGKKEQIDFYADQFQQSKIKSRVWSIWYNLFVNKTIQKENFKRALFKLKCIDTREKKFDVRRAVKLWSNTDHLMSQQLRVLKNVMNRHIDKQKSIVLQKILDFSMFNSSLARQQTLCISSAARIFKHLAFIKFGITIKIVKEKRLKKLALILKQWQDRRKYKKYMMASNVLATQLLRQSKRRLLAELFFEIRFNKEIEKFELMNNTLKNKIQPQISSIETFMLEKATKSFQIRKVRALKCFARYSCSALAGYFNQWKKGYLYYKNQGSNLIRAFMMRKYKVYILQAILRWKQCTRFVQLQVQTFDNDQLQTTQIDLDRQIAELTAVVQSENQRQRKIKLLCLNNAIQIFNTRAQKNGVRRWNLQCFWWRRNERQLKIFIKKVHFTIRRRAFSQYQYQIEMQKYSERQQRQINNFLQEQKNKKKKKIFKAFTAYHARFNRSKRYYQIVQKILDVWIKRRSMVIWQESAHSISLSLTSKNQNQQTITYDMLNEKLGLKVSQLTKQNEGNKQLKKDLKDQAQRVLSNCFARYYYVKAERGFKKWNDAVKFEQHREQLIKGINQKYITNMFYQVKSAFQNWISRQNIEITTQKINHTLIITDQTKLATAEKIKQHEQIRQQCLQSKQNNYLEHANTEQKWSNVLEKIIRKNETNYYQSLKRFIIQQWCAFTKRQKHFVHSIIKVVSKNLWKTGFIQVSQHASFIKLQNMRKQVCIGMKRMFNRKRFQKSMSQWKSAALRYTLDQYKHKNQVKEEKIVYFSNEWLKNVKEQNCKRATKYTVQRRLANILKSWRNVHQWLKVSKALRHNYKEVRSTQKKIRTLKKWFDITNHNLSCFRKYQRLKKISAKIYRAAIFRTLKKNWLQQRHLCHVLNNIAKKYNNRAVEMGLRLIKGYSTMKKKIKKDKKKKSALDLFIALSWTLKMKKSEYYIFFKRKTLGKRIMKKAMTYAIGPRARIFRLREALWRWRNKNSFFNVVDDVNESGPVVEEVLNQQIRQQNLQFFMKDQAYTTRQIEDIVDHCKSQVQSRLKRVVHRLMVFNTRKGTKTILFDRWRNFTRLRKLMTYILRNVQNQLQPIRADLSIAFNRWRLVRHKRMATLNGTDRFKLIEQAISLKQSLSLLDEFGSEKTQELHLYKSERDFLCEKYFVGQKLAIAASRDNYERAQSKAFLQLSDNCHLSKSDQLTALLQRRVDQIHHLKEQAQFMERKNYQISQDNEQLRQQSLDGFDIGNGAQKLSYDRQRLSVDLADKAIMIKKLLQQNEELKRMFREVQSRIQL